MAKKEKESGKPTDQVMKEATNNVLTTSCFVMMPFSEPINSYYELIFKPAIIKAKLEPIRADDLFRPSPIMSDLWKMIQDAEVVLAELTSKNANVFYELGLAHAIGKPVIMVSETMADVPFDLQQLRVLLYNKDDPKWGDILVTSIVKAINEVLKEPLEAVPLTFKKLVPSNVPEQDEAIAKLEDIEGRLKMVENRSSSSFDNNFDSNKLEMMFKDYDKSVRLRNKFDMMEMMKEGFRTFVTANVASDDLSDSHD